MEDRNIRNSRQNGANNTAHSNSKAGKKEYKVQNIFLALFGFLLILLLLYTCYVMFVKGDSYREKSDLNQILSVNSVAERGTISDRNGNVMATSASCYLIFIDTKSYTRDTSLTADAKKQIQERIITYMCPALGIDEDTMRGYIDKKQSYIVLKHRIEQDEKDKLQNIINEHDLNQCFGFEYEPIRYYNYGSLGSTVLGFTNQDGTGVYGIEYKYNDALAGNNGKVQSVVDGRGDIIPGRTSTTYDAKNGENLILTIDVNIQKILEDALSEARDKYSSEGAYGIIINSKTAAVLAMASLPDYSAADPYSITDEALSDMYKEYSTYEEPVTDEDEHRLDELSTYQERQWANRCVSYALDPGSVFKVCTASMAYEEKVVDLDTVNTIHPSIEYAGNVYSCWTDSHVYNDFRHFLANSCNPFAVQLAIKLGKEKFYDYFESFGFTENTGIDLPGESTGNLVIYSRNEFTSANAASSSFGETFKVTPLQMLMAVNCVATGGKLLTPYVVGKMTDSNGNVVSEKETNVKRQVISEETASTVKDMMKLVVTEGTGQNAYVSGYSIAAKTGTAQDSNDTTGKTYSPSFCGFAPADDPEISAIIVIDRPQGYHGAATVAAPVAKKVFKQTLEYLGVKKSYTDEEAENKPAEVPSVTGVTTEKAQETAENAGYTLKIIGDGANVVSQSPSEGEELGEGGIIIAYTDSGAQVSNPVMPDLKGMTESEAAETLHSLGFNINVDSKSSGTVDSQSVEAGKSVQLGTIVTVTLTADVDILD